MIGLKFPVIRGSLFGAFLPETLGFGVPRGIEPVNFPSFSRQRFLRGAARERIRTDMKGKVNNVCDSLVMAQC